jgi:GNAT superfamily N-acetyltransferase
VDQSTDAERRNLVEALARNGPWHASRARARAEAPLAWVVELRGRHQELGRAGLARALGSPGSCAVGLVNERLACLDALRTRSVAGAARWHDVGRRVVERVAVDMVGNEGIRLVALGTYEPTDPASAPVTGVPSGPDPIVESRTSRAHQPRGTRQRVVGQVADPAMGSHVLPPRGIRAAFGAEPPEQTRRPRELGPAILT